ncbi:hypothetical protein NM688_g1863 [Phlebia brevispora]|uniref:Uncharacterized protein n=1 Tax=Phlebia brevispora TaxID=194682 RepID=A0ACC1TAH7_9APHY|nr:hypothetical protein NM688_g1863 [Phlebia brevispora]
MLTDILTDVLRTAMANATAMESWSRGSLAWLDDAIRIVIALASPRAHLSETATSLLRQCLRDKHMRHTFAKNIIAPGKTTEHWQSLVFMTLTDALKSLGPSAFRDVVHWGYVSDDETVDAESYGVTYNQILDQIRSSDGNGEANAHSGATLVTSHTLHVLVRLACSILNDLVTLPAAVKASKLDASMESDLKDLLLFAVGALYVTEHLPSSVFISLPQSVEDIGLDEVAQKFRTTPLLLMPLLECLEAWQDAFYSVTSTWGMFWRGSSLRSMLREEKDTTLSILADYLERTPRPRLKMSTAIRLYFSYLDLPLDNTEEDRILWRRISLAVAKMVEGGARLIETSQAASHEPPAQSDRYLRSYLREEMTHTQQRAYIILSAIDRDDKDREGTQAFRIGRPSSTRSVSLTDREREIEDAQYERWAVQFDPSRSFYPDELITVLARVSYRMEDTLDGVSAAAVPVDVLRVVHALAREILKPPGTPAHFARKTCPVPSQLANTSAQLIGIHTVLDVGLFSPLVMGYSTGESLDDRSVHACPHKLDGDGPAMSYISSRIHQLIIFDSLHCFTLISAQHPLPSMATWFSEFTDVVIHTPCVVNGVPVKMAARCYRPNHCSPSTAGLTLLFLHGVGSHKEFWEPVLDSLFRRRETSRKKTPLIREVWLLDCQTHGDSALLNSSVEWTSESLFSITWAEAIAFLCQTRLAFHRVVCISNSGGALASLGSVQHYSPRPSPPYEAIILIEPIVFSRSAVSREDANTWKHGIEILIKATMKRRDVWNSSQEAFSYFTKRFPWNTWDEAMVHLLVKHGLRPIHDGSPQLTLKCPKHLEAGSLNVPAETIISAMEEIERLCEKVPIHILFGEYDDLMTPHPTKNWIRQMNRANRLASVTFVPGTGHMVVLQKPALVAQWLCKILAEHHPFVSSTMPGPLGQSSNSVATRARL